MKRRTLLGGLAAVVAVAGGTVWALRPVRKHYPPTPYDGLLNQIVDRDTAARFGARSRIALAIYDTGALAAQLRGSHYARAAALDAGANRVTEVDGWIVPTSVARYAALAFQVQGLPG